MNALTVPETSAVTIHADALKAMLRGVGAVVELKPATLALVDNGLQVQVLLDKVAADIELAEALDVDSPDMLAEAQTIMGRLAAVCADTGAIEEERKALAAPFYDLWKKINAGYAPARERVGKALELLKSRAIAYNEKVKAEAAAAAAVERERRQKEADDAAAAEREAQAKANSLIEQAQKLQADGATVTAGALVAEAAVVADAGRQVASAALANMHTAVYVAPVARAKGVSEKWTGVVSNKVELVQHIAKRLVEGDASLLHLLEVDQSALNKKANAEREHFKLPGCRAERSTGMSVRKGVL